MSMDQATLEALRGSIAKWEGIVAGTVEDKGPDNCPLCQMFWARECEGCPVRVRTGLTCCAGTPYRDFESAWRFHDSGLWRTLRAKEELAFLRSLLPAGEQS